MCYATWDVHFLVCTILRPLAMLVKVLLIAWDERLKRAFNLWYLSIRWLLHYLSILAIPHIWLPLCKGNVGWSRFLCKVPDPHEGNLELLFWSQLISGLSFQHRSQMSWGISDSILSRSPWGCDPQNWSIGRLCLQTSQIAKLQWPPGHAAGSFQPGLWNQKHPG